MIDSIIKLKACMEEKGIDSSAIELTVHFPSHSERTRFSYFMTKELSHFSLGFNAFYPVELSIFGMKVHLKVGE